MGVARNRLGKKKKEKILQIFGRNDCLLAVFMIYLSRKCFAT